jgi:hypothetical protein
MSGRLLGLTRRAAVMNNPEGGTLIKASIRPEKLPELPGSTTQNVAAIPVVNTKLFRRLPGAGLVR